MKRRFINIILRLCTAIVVGGIVFSCNKEEFPGNAITGSVKVDFAFEVNDESSTRAENTIKDVKVWAFEIKTDGTPLDENGIASAYVEADFNNTNTVETVSMYIPVSASEKKYRFFAVVNEASFGKVFHAREYGNQTPLVLDGHITYKELSAAVFDATEVASAYLLDPTAPMPFSHWAEATFKDGDSNPSTITIDVFRPVAKVEFHAKLQDGINYTFKVNGIKLLSSKIAIPVQGAVFSDYSPAELNSATSPSIFGKYADLQVSTQPAPAILYNIFDNNTASFVAKKITESSDLVGSACIFENNHGEEYIAGTTDTSSPNEYANGTLYLQIDYSYTKKSGPEDSSSGRCYMPLPRIVRNNIYKINATFDMNKEGMLILAYSVEDWTTIEGQLNFTYPTVEISAVKKNADNTLYYGQPVCNRDNSFAYNGTDAPTINDGAFAFYFKMEGLDGVTRPWTVHYTEYTHNGSEWVLDTEQKDDFELAVCKGDESDIIKSGDEHKLTFDPAGHQYQIRLYPKKNKGTSVKAADIYITYPAEWLGGAADELLINAGGGGTLWTNSGGERYKIRVIQGDDIP